MIVQAIPVVVDSLPLVEEFTGPGFYQVHHEHIAAVPAVTEFFPMSDDEGGELSAGVAACSALGALATRADPAAHFGADDRVLRARADARSRRSCAADSGLSGRSAQDPRQVGA